MGAPYSPPPLWPGFLAFAGLFVWGYLCGRVRDKIVSLLLVPSHLLALSIYYPGMFSQITAVTSLSWFLILFVVPGYLVGFFGRREKRNGSALEAARARIRGELPKENDPSSVSSVLRFLSFILYAAAFFVSFLYLVGYSFPTGYYFAAIYVAIAAVVYVFLRKRMRRISPQ